MAWDFSTEPEFQEQLDWVEDFCRTEIEPLDLVFPGAAWSRNPKAKSLGLPGFFRDFVCLFQECAHNFAVSITGN